MFKLLKEFEGKEAYCLLQLARKDAFESIEDLVLYLNLSEDVVVELIELKEIPYEETPTGKLFKREALDQWLLENRQNSGLELLVDSKMEEISLLKEKYHDQRIKFVDLKEELRLLIEKQQYVNTFIKSSAFINFGLLVILLLLITFFVGK